MKRLLGAVAGFLMVGTVLAQANTTAGTAANVQWGQKVLSSVECGHVPVLVCDDGSNPEVLLRGNGPD